MTQRQQWGIVAGVVLLLALVLGAGVHFLGDELFPVSVGSKAPPIHGVTLDSAKREKTLGDYKGKVVLLNVWATWCEPCRVEMPSIEKLHREFGPHGLSVVAISVDPETFLIARDGVIRKKLIGASDWSSEGNRALVRELLGGTTASR
ncbi:MAG: TlpA family protein disulfide reductase [Gemmatimonadetes bacterium]|nr:TlpA family protein disulfide reductase [Gemmatimonadota bacterium]